MKRHSTTAVALVFACLLAPDWLSACDDGMVRDAAFDQPRDLYRLCVIARSDDRAATETAKRLEKWLATSGTDLNLEVVSVAADAPDVPWTDFGIPSAPPSLPVVVLVGTRTGGRKHFVIDHWEPSPSDADLESLRFSPAREAIRQHTAEDLAVVVYVPGTIESEEDVETVIDRARSSQSGGIVATSNISVVKVDRNDLAERLLLTFANTPPEGPAWACVVFGKGKFMTPLEGDEITVAGLVDQFDALAADCTCSQSPSRLGVDVLMEWNADADETVVRLASGDETATADTAASGPSSAGSPTESDDLDSAVLPGFLTVLLWSLGGLTLISVVAAIAIVRRRPSEAIGQSLRD